MVLQISPNSYSLSSIFLRYKLCWRGSTRYSTPWNNFDCSNTSYPQLAPRSSTWRSVCCQLTCHSFVDSVLGPWMASGDSHLNQHFQQLKKGYDNVLAKVKVVSFHLIPLHSLGDSLGFTNNLNLQVKCHIWCQVSPSHYGLIHSLLMQPKSVPI